VGVALGDGNLSRPNGRATRLRITCDAKYQAISNDIQKALRELFPDNRVSVVPRTETYFDISVYSNNLNQWMPWKVGMGSKKIQRAAVPEWIKSSEEYVRKCLKGLIQTDGCIYTDRGYKMIMFTNNSEALARSTFELFCLLGFNPTFNGHRNGHLNKYDVRLARKAEVSRALRILKLEKTRTSS